MYRQTQVEPAKSNKSKCKKCKKTIEKGQMRAKIVDDRQFRQYLRRNPDARGCEGYSRGYFQTQNGVISIQKYFVHLDCYKPIHPHPIQRQYFKLKSAKGVDKQKFNSWFDQKQQQSPPKQDKNKSKPKPKKETPKSKSKPKTKSK